MTTAKPIGRKAYGSIGHLPNSRLGPMDKCVHAGMARICTERARDKRDRIVVQEKVDGSCVAVAKVDGKIIALQRHGYEAATSRRDQHRMFAWWVKENESRFAWVLSEGERLVGEWVAQAHGTRYAIDQDEDPFFAFDIMREVKRVAYDDFRDRVIGVFRMPATVHVGGPIAVDEAMELHETSRHSAHPVIGDSYEGIVYRVHRHGKIDFLAKWVRPDKIDGKYLPEISGGETVWNWRPSNWEVA